MKKRGKVLRDTTSGPGLLMVEGQQYRFSLEGVWKSDGPPRPGLVVDVELDAGGKVQSITVVPESQLANEKADAALARPKGQNAVFAAATKIGIPSLTAGSLLAIAWFFLPAVSVQVPFPGKLEFTFWQILGFLNARKPLDLLDQSGNPSPGIYGLLAIAALAGPFLHRFWRDKRMALSGLLPLIFIVVVGIAVRSSILGALGGGGQGSYGEAAKQARDEAMKAVSLGLGTYISILASLYFAFSSARTFLVSKASEAPKLEPKERKAA